MWDHTGHMYSTSYRGWITKLKDRDLEMSLALFIIYFLDLGYVKKVFNMVFSIQHEQSKAGSPEQKLCQ